MISIKEASELLGITPKTLRIWEKEGKITSHRTNGGHRRYLIAELLGDKNGKDKVTIGYARVSSHDQKAERLIKINFSILKNQNSARQL